MTWDEIVAAGWGPDYAAGAILKELREPGGSVTLAAWYFTELMRMGRGVVLSIAAQERKSIRSIQIGRANAVQVKLKEILTAEEWTILRNAQ